MKWAGHPVRPANSPKGNRNEHEIDYYLPDDWHGAKTLYGNYVEENKVKVDGLGVAILER